MEDFEIFYERRERNPLRKRELETHTIDNKVYVDNELEHWKRQNPHHTPQSLEQKKSELYSRYIKKKITPDYVPVMNKFGFKVFVEPGLDFDMSPGSYNYRVFDYSLKNLVRNYKDILPIRKPKIIIGDTNSVDLSDVGKNFVAGGLYMYGDKIIYIDPSQIDEPDVLVHEYAHYVSDLIPVRVRPILQKAYEDMLAEFFGNRRRKHLQGDRNIVNRRKVAEKLGLPSDYSATNFDEFFAELITHWKNLPNDVSSYKLKRIVKKVLTQL